MNLGDLRAVLPIPNQLPTLLVSASKDFVSIGPISQCNDSICFLCLQHWLETASAGSTGLVHLPGVEEARLAAEMIDAVAARVESDGLPNYWCHALATTGLPSRKTNHHPIFPLRDCPNCARLDTIRGADLRIHCSRVTGIVQSMELSVEPSAGSYRAKATWASPLPVNRSRPPLDRQHAYGRGRTRKDAELGCIGEALERYSVIYRGDEPLVRARMAELPAVDPREILLYSEQQYESRRTWNRSSDERYFVGERFDPERPIDWFPATDLVNGAERFVPAAATLMWYQVPASEPEIARADSIGCGSGLTFDDAVAHALLEWIERDAMAIWWYNRAIRPGLCLESFDSPDLLTVRDGLRAAGRDLVLLDCTTDIGIPVYVSIAASDDGSEPIFSGASHPSPRLAAWKAASEVGQIWYNAVRRQGIDTEIHGWLELIHGSPQAYMMPSGQIEAPAEPPPLQPAELVRFIVERLQRAGLRPYVADLSRSDVLLRTARAVVPGLRHIWNRRAPGRLYETAVDLGWRMTRLTEEELNPHGCMI